MNVSKFYRLREIIGDRKLGIPGICRSHGQHGMLVLKMGVIQNPSNSLKRLLHGGYLILRCWSKD